jgi:D-amino-acid dehydrogenase
MPKAIVLGAGAVGLSSAYQLRRAGFEVTVFDPAPLTAKASGHNAGWLVPSMATPVPAPGGIGQALGWLLKPDSPLYVKPSLSPRFVSFMIATLRNCTTVRFEAGAATLASLASGALASFDDLVAEGVQFEMHDNPMTMLFTSEHKRDAHIEELRLIENKLPGFGWHELNPSDLAASMPRVTAKVAAGIESHGDRHADPASFVRGMAAACERAGVELRIGEQASLELGRGSAVQVRTWTGIERPDQIVVAAGVWSNRVLRPLGESLALQAGKGYGFDFPVVPGGPTGPVYLAEAKVAINPLDTKVRAAGTMGFSPIDESISRVRAVGILKGIREYFADWPGPAHPQHPWTGMRPMTPDGVPLIGPLNSTSNVLVATGHAMLGVTLGPVTGRIIADLATGRAEPLAALAPQRFSRTRSQGGVPNRTRMSVPVP